MMPLEIGAIIILILLLVFGYKFFIKPIIQIIESVLAIGGFVIGGGLLLYVWLSSDYGVTELMHDALGFSELKMGYGIELAVKGWSLLFSTGPLGDLIDWLMKQKINF